MGEKLSWEEVKRRYPDEWVAFVDYEWPADEPAVSSGAVFAHNRSRKQLVQLLKGQRHVAVLFTGEPRGPRFLFAVDVDPAV